jgi:hypothetical protein
MAVLFVQIYIKIRAESDKFLDNFYPLKAYALDNSILKNGSMF